ncbi:hypothetical protein [Microlunatus spumicola]|uniref:hypothetical protein n=1 Tax=Microlunatus spumicola TaxID=81499 RepID=UPI00195AEE8C
MSVERPGSDEQIFDLGFPPWTVVTGRPSVADLYFSKRQRSGIYVLGFANGERYVGLTTDVVRRFAQHRRRHNDIRFITFQRVAQAKQATTERTFIRQLEAGGVPLRNRAEMSVITGEHDLDEVVAPSEQARWLERGPIELDASGRVEDADLRRRYRGQMIRLGNEPLGAAAVRVLSRYVPLALPAPRSTELSFWSLSCMPSGTRVKMLARLNLNMQEVLGLFEQDNVLVAALQLASSPFAEQYGSRWQSEVKALGFGLEDFQYKAAGHDQFRLYAEGEPDILRLLDLQVVNRAVRLLNLNLMRKGPSYWSRNHCFALADAVYGDASDKLATRGSGHSPRPPAGTADR